MWETQVRTRFCLLIFALLWSAMLITGCERKVIYHTSQGEKAEVTFSDVKSSRRDLNDFSNTNREIEWIGDATSRIVFYARAPSFNASRTMSAAAEDQDADFYMPAHFLAYDHPWPLFKIKKPLEILGNIERVKQELPTPCIGTECTSWTQVRSIDLGRCSIELPYGKMRSPVPSPVLEAVGQRRLKLGDMLLNGILDETVFNKISGNFLAQVRVIINPSYERSSWWISQENDDLCIDAQADFSHKSIRGFLVVPVSKRCVKRPLSIKFCGKISTTAEHTIKWSTTSLDVGLTKKHSECNKKVINEVRKNVESMITGSNNMISQALTEELGNSLSISAKQLYTFAEKADKKNNSTRGSTVELLQSLGIRETCSNPKPFPGRATRTCFSGLVPGRCVEDISGDTTKGLCKIETPIQRIESTPTGIEVILVDYKDKGHNDWLWEWTHGSFSTLVDLDILKTIRDFSCIKPSTEDRKNAQTPSRVYERLFRYAETVKLGGPR